MKIDYLKPDYSAIFAQRAKRLAKIRADNNYLEACRIHYKDNPWDFINDWGMTFEPRNLEKKLIANIPFILFPRQIEFLKWVHEKWSNSEPGIVEKSRDYGATWLCVGWAISMFLFWDGFSAGFGSRKEDLVDKKGDPKSIFEKARYFLNFLPREFRPLDYKEHIHTSYLKILNPENGSTITGEGGDNIGRGARMSIYFVDESAFIQNQEAKDAALSQTTNCQIDVSTPNGNGNAFYRKRHNGKVDCFIMDWRDDPRKTEEWYQKQCNELDEVIVAQEIDRDYNASQENVFIPAKWVEAAIDAHKKLGWDGIGSNKVSFDPADVGDAKALIGRKGNVVRSGKQINQGDIRDAIPIVRDFVREEKADAFIYDASGMGAPIIKLTVDEEFERKDIELIDHHGGGAIREPEKLNKSLDRDNVDAFYNRRAQFWYEARQRFEAVYNAVVKGIYINPDDMISIDSAGFSERDLQTLKAELSRPQRKYMNDGRIKVESKEEMKKRGVQSPNLADALVMTEENIKTKRKKKRTATMVNRDYNPLNW